MHDEPGRPVGPADGVRGRRPRTTRARLAEVALRLFARDGFEATTVDDIADAAGIARRTFFRYYATKADVVWGEFDAELERLRERFRRAPEGLPIVDVVRTAVVATNRFGAGELDQLRTRIELTATVPALVAHSAVQYQAWCDVVAEFAARRLGADPGELGPQTVARACLGAALAAFTVWAARPDEDLDRCLDEAFRILAAGCA
ncbi:MAG: mycofactocin system transcriptional regulator [Actinomycetota bacterium]|jgi:mycofactocin system transcriptional regulator|nr:mycofactocin system transcriptional regulator [Actinomycetota bacterium]